MMGIFFIVSNTILTLLAAFGIYSFSHSVLWAILGALVITGSASANPLFALLAYPAVEYFFNNGHLTIFSAMIVGITLIQMIIIFIVSARSR